MRGEVTTGNCIWGGVVVRVGITAGAWVVVLRTAMALVETVDTVVDVVVLDRAGRPAIVVIVPIAFQEYQDVSETLLLNFVFD